ncbi:MAG: flagellin [Clostridiales bacterium]|nr:flagellin [Clostridiales bacterium]
MRIQHNIMAMSAYRNYTNNVSAMKKNLEKLSSGYKINRAGDDAAGLAISEKMRAQITGLETAQKNAKDGISLVQTAEGALQEVHDMLNRMVELATQSANGTYEGDTDRAQLQKEITQLKSEINRIADSANFNGIKLLNGDMDGSMKLGTLTDIADDITPVADGEQAAVTESKAGVYEIDLSDMKLTGDGAQDISITKFKIGTAEFMKSASTAVDLSTLDDADEITGEALATALNGSTITLDGIKYDVKGENGKLTLTSTEVPDDENDLTKNFKVDFAYTNAVDGTNGWDQSVHIKEAAQVAGSSKLAQGEFTLDNTIVKDGGVLQIGKETYVFQVGKDSKVTEGTGYKVIDLSKYEADDANLVQAAATKLSQQNNPEFHITTKGEGAASVTMHLTERADAIDYSKSDYDLTGDNGGSLNGDGNADATWANVVKTGTMSSGNGKSLTLQIGDTAADYNQLKVNISDCHAAAIGVGDIDITTQEGAAEAIDKIKAAINYVSDVRGTLGATQNRLDHTINNLSVMTENIQDAESTIRDVDIAEEMMAYTKNNILIQSAQAMLAQANQVPQGVLQLLQ